jgi:glycosyltransferase involved in cell wall biosynthesis
MLVILKIWAKFQPRDLSNSPFSSESLSLRNSDFPEIDFWEGYSFFEKIKKKGIDFLRLKRTLNAEGLIFENESMLERAVTLFKYSEKNVKYIEPSVSEFEESALLNEYSKIEKEKEFKVLYLSSFYMNKNIHILPLVAKVLKEKGHKVKFVLTLTKNDLNLQKRLIEVIESNSVDEYFEFIGKVSPIYVHQIVKACDSMILLSKLECFSSNVMEAFYFEKPLVISDEIWARSACKNAALYVDRNDALSIAEGIIRLKENKNEIQELVLKGQERMLDFSTPIEKIKKQINFLEYIFRSYEKIS